MQEIQGKTWEKILVFLRGQSSIYLGTEDQKIYQWSLMDNENWRTENYPNNMAKGIVFLCIFNRWSAKGIWNSLYQNCIEDINLENLLIERTVIRSHPCASKGGSKSS